MRALPWLLVLGSVWGLTPSIAKGAVGAGVPPLAMAFGTAAVSALILGGLCAWRRLPIRWDAAHLRHHVAGGLTGYALANLIAFTALQHVPAGYYALLMPLSPILTVLGAALLGMERATARRWWGSALGFGGVALAMAPGAALPDGGALLWALLAVLVPVGFAASNLVAAGWAPPGSPPLALAAGTLAAAAGFLLVFAAAAGQLHLPGNGAEWLIPLQGALTAFAYLLYFRLIAREGGVVTSQTGYVVTIAGILWGAALFGERMGWLALPAAAMVLAGLFLVRKR